MRLPLIGGGMVGLFGGGQLGWCQSKDSLLARQVRQHPSAIDSIPYYTDLSSQIAATANVAQAGTRNAADHKNSAAVWCCFNVRHFRHVPVIYALVYSELRKRSWKSLYLVGLLHSRNPVRLWDSQLLIGLLIMCLGQLSKASLALSDIICDMLFFAGGTCDLLQ